MNRILMALTLLLIASCSQPEPSGPVASWPATRKSDGGGFSVTLQPSVKAIERSGHFSLDVGVKPSGGEGEISVLVNADMPEHQHGMNTQPEIALVSPRRYRVDGMLFHMAGDWEIYVDVTRSGSSERAVFPVRVE